MDGWENIMSNLQDVKLNPDNDSFIIIKFTGVQSAAFEVFPVNVSPAQMFAASRMLDWQAEHQMNNAVAQKEVEKTVPQIMRVEPGTVLRDAK